MSEEKIIISLLVAGGIFFLIYFIYNAVKQEKENEEIEKQRLIREKELEELKIKERKKRSIEWNKKVQDKFKDKIKYQTNKPIKALIGDYTDSMAPYTNSKIKMMGIDTEVVPTASDVIDRINDGNKYDIIITNNVYPNGESGQKVLDTLKEIDNFKIPIVILTVDQNARDKYLCDGFDEYIEKPIDEDKIKKVFPTLIKGLEFSKIKSNKSK